MWKMHEEEHKGAEILKVFNISRRLRKNKTRSPWPRKIDGRSDFIIKENDSF